MNNTAPEETLFLRQIVEAPVEDDAPRLVFADWLEERGDLRGELIRIQCELAKISHDTDELNDAEFEHFEQLQTRNDELQRIFETSWFKPLRNYTRTFRYHRGLVEYVDVDALKLAEFGDQLFQLAPIRFMTIRHVATFLPGSSRLRKCLNVDGLRQLTGLAFDDSHLSADDVDALTALLDQSRVTRLILSGCRINDNSFAPFENLQASQLRELDLSFNRLRNRSALALANTRGLSELCSLDLSENGVRLRGAQALAKSAHLANLKLLMVANNPLSAEGRAVELLRERFERVELS